MSFTVRCLVILLLLCQVQRAVAEDLEAGLLPGRFFEGAVLNFLAPDTPTFHARQRLDREFTQVTGIVVRWVFTEPGSIERRLRLSRKTDGQPYDIVALPGPILSQDTSNLFALNNLVARDRVGRAPFPAGWSASVQQDSQVFALPITIDRLVTFTNAGKFRRMSAGLADGSMLLPAWLMALDAEGLEIVDVGGQPAWSSPLVVRKTEEFMRQFAGNSDAATTQDASDRRESIAPSFDTPSFPEVGAYARPTSTRLDDARLMLPVWLVDVEKVAGLTMRSTDVEFVEASESNVLPLDLWGLSIPLETRQKDAAWEFIKWATSSSVEREVAGSTGRLLTPRLCAICDDGVYPAIPEPDAIMRRPGPDIQVILRSALGRIHRGEDASTVLGQTEDEAIQSLKKLSP